MRVLQHPSTPLPPLLLGAPARSVGVLAGLRAEDRALGMRVQIAPGPRPLPGRDCIAYLTAVSVAIMADHDRHLDTLRVIDDIAAAAPDVHVLAMALAPVAAQLEQPLPGTDWAANLRAVLPVTELLKAGA